MSTPGPRVAWLQVLGGSLGTVAAGLLVWLSVSSVLVSGTGAPMRELMPLQAMGLAASAVGLVLAGLAQWRSTITPGPWRRRANLAWLLALTASLVLLVQNRVALTDPGWSTLCAAAACLSALAWICFHALLGRGNADTWVPLRLALALYGGLAVVLALLNWRWAGAMPAGAALSPLLLMGVPALLLLILAWKREFGPARAWPWEVLILLAALPWLLAASSLLAPRLAAGAWPLASLAILAGIVLERLRSPARSGA